MKRIHVLEKQVAELIAAGEVIERPSSVVKELLENSIDAGADTITLEISHGGKELIKITDNGCGIQKEDVRDAFLRHATSKIREQDDLDHIGTLGFRGEALASIAAVSKVQLITKHAQDPHGIKYVLAGSEEVSLEETGCPNGSTIVITDLFYNVPARKKFLKKDRTEGAAIASILDVIALSHPDISFRFIQDGKPVMQTPGTGDLYDAIHAVFGASFAKKMMKVKSENGEISVSGYASIPTECRANRTMQYFFINGRYVKSNACVSALEEAYQGSIMIGKFPACVLFLTMPLDSLDINVHPAKIEVRFSDEGSVMRSVYIAVKEGISEYNRSVISAAQVAEKQQVQSFDFKGEDTISYQQLSSFPTDLQDGTAVKIRSEARTAGDVSDFSYLSARSFQKEPEPENAPEIRIIPENPEEGFSGKKKREIAKENAIKEPEATSVRIVGEIFKTYILAEVGDQFILVDKHAAHERILYNKLKKEQGNLNRQLLVVPIAITLSKREWDVVDANRDVFEKLGFAIEAFGEKEIILREVPSILQKEDCGEVFGQIVNNLLKDKQDVTPESLDGLLHTIACKAAIKANDQNHPLELKKLFDEVYYNENVRYCPHGRPVILTFSRQKIESRFGR